jgi:hypothetical protein
MRNRAVELERLRILDFYLLFPFLLRDIQFPASAIFHQAKLQVPNIQIICVYQCPSVVKKSSAQVAFSGLSLGNREKIAVVANYVFSRRTDKMAGKMNAEFRMKKPDGQNSLAVRKNLCVSVANPGHLADVAANPRRSKAIQPNR